MKTFTIMDKQFHLDENTHILSLDQKNRISDSEEKLRYLKHQNDTQGYQDYMNNLYQSFIKPYLKSGQTLDFGCGPKQMFKGLIMGLSAYDKFFFKDDVVFDQTYDNILLIEVIEHLHKPLLELEKLIGILNDGGRLFIKTQFYNLDLLSNWWYLRDQTHVSFFNEKSFLYISKRFSLKIIYTDNKQEIILEKCYNNT